MGGIAATTGEICFIGEIVNTPKATRSSWPKPACTSMRHAFSGSGKAAQMTAEIVGNIQLETEKRR